MSDQSAVAGLKVLFHDYGGHAFTAQLARQTARLGAETVYASFAGFGTPKGRVGASDADPKGFRAIELNIAGKFDKDNLLKRSLQQAEYARVAAALVKAERPDVVISSNSPIEVQAAMLKACRQVGAGFVYWLQDIHSEAIARILRKKNALAGDLAGRFYRMRERQLLAASDAVVTIADSFRDLLGNAPWSMDVANMHVIENWAPIEDIPLMNRENDWAARHMRSGRKRIVYTGTLARKHNPDLLLELARNVDADIYLFSQGSAPDYVRDRAATEGLSNLFVGPWVAVDDLPKMLAAADILYAVIEPEAGVFSVPSKVLSYLAAGRAILGSIPLNNLASQTVMRADAGRIVAPDNTVGLLAAAEELLSDDAGRTRMGNNGRAYAERTFRIADIAKKFAEIAGSAAR